MLSKIEGAPFRGRAVIAGTGSGEVAVWIRDDSITSLEEARQP